MGVDKRKWRAYRVECVVCKKDCAASLRGAKGDWTEAYPRRHKVDGVYCEGILKIAPFIEDKKPFHPVEADTNAFAFCQEIGESVSHPIEQKGRGR